MWVACCLPPYQVLAAKFPADVWYAVYYPVYGQSTSSYHPLRGSVLIHFWHAVDPRHGRLDDGDSIPRGLIALDRRASRIPSHLASAYNPEDDVSWVYTPPMQSSAAYLSLPWRRWVVLGFPLWPPYRCNVPDCASV